MKPEIIPGNLAGKSLFDFIVKNEKLIEHAKKSAVKFADSAHSVPMFIDEKGQLVSKAEMVETQMDPTKLKVVPVINTTNWFDSHWDVHIPGLWKKSLADNKKQGFYLLESHGRGFKDVIAEGCKADAVTMTWKELGINLPGNTEALLFTCLLEKSRNEFMFGQYQQKYVKQHSVGMRYIKMATCINDEDYPVQKENWDKYFPMVANGSDAEKEGFFWAILEGGVLEGSSVLFGSNCMTPTMEVSEYEDSTKNQPPSGTGDQPRFNVLEAISKTTFIKI